MGIQNMSHSMPQWFILLLERATLIHTYSLKWDLDMIWGEKMGKRCPTWMTLRYCNQSDFEISWVSRDLEVSHCSSVPSHFEISPCSLIRWTSTVPAAAAVHSRQVELHKITSDHATQEQPPLHPSLHPSYHLPSIHFISSSIFFHLFTQTIIPLYPIHRFLWRPPRLFESPLPPLGHQLGHSGSATNPDRWSAAPGRTSEPEACYWVSKPKKGHYIYSL